MARFKARAPGVEVSGVSMLALLNGMDTFRRMGIEILAKNGIVNPQPRLWYRQQAWLDSFEEIAEAIGPTTLYRIGREIPKSVYWPKNVTDIEHGLASIDVAYHLNHRGGEIGHYKFTLLEPGHATIVCDDPYPCTFDLGIIEETANRFASGRHVTVHHDDTKPCRDNGGEMCVYDVRWE